MRESNPIDLGRRLETTIRRYLRSALPISRNYPKLANEIEQLLNERDLLLKGPFIESIPDFQKGLSLQSLTRGESPLLHTDFDRLPENEFSRPLHRHQEEALRTIIGEARNVVVTTGTGSGKTECFLYPVLDALLNESLQEREKPGVRALLVYPLNALANDQLYKRIVPLFVGRFASAGIKVGRFTGLTRDDTRRENAVQDVLATDPSLRDFFGKSIPTSWQLTRQEMLAHPPHILITNYAMLEHLLLFPKNAALFHHPALRFLVLDEIHTYTGVQASEVAFLLRKLRNRLGLASDKIRCIGTSASFAEGETVEKSILKFASDLFGSSFTRVVRGERREHSLLKSEADSPLSLAPSAWTKLGKAVSIPNSSNEDTVETWNTAVGGLDLSDIQKSALALSWSEPVEPALARIFSQAREMRIASESLAGIGAMPFAALSERVFGEGLEESESGLAGLVSIGIRARVSPNGFSLLPARYHFFANGVDNVTVRLGGGVEGFTLARMGSHFEENGEKLFRLLVCRKCGQPFVEGFHDGPVLFTTRGKTSRGKRCIFWLGNFAAQVDDEDDENVDETEAQIDIWNVNPRTGD